MAMGMIECVNCGESIGTRSKKCKHCGKSPRRKSPQAKLNSITEPFHGEEKIQIREKIPVEIVTTEVQVSVNMTRDQVKNLLQQLAGKL